MLDPPGYRESHGMHAVRVRKRRIGLLHHNSLQFCKPSRAGSGDRDRDEPSRGGERDARFYLSSHRPMGDLQRRAPARAVRLRCQARQRRGSAPRRFQRQAGCVYARKIAPRGLHLSDRIRARDRCRENRHGYGRTSGRAKSLAILFAHVRALRKSRRRFSDGERNPG